MNLLEKIAQRTKERYREIKKEVSLDTIRKIAEEEKTQSFLFEEALSKDELSFICEVKKASPSKGIIADQFPYLDIAMEYESADADAISCLTEPDWFLGSAQYLRDIVSKVKIPVLRKDFTVDAYQLYETKVLGASAVLLICALLDKSQLKEYLAICDSLGLSALVEVHGEKEIQMAVDCGARIIGVNNRNLKDFTVDVSTSKKLRELVPEDILFVSESGVKGQKDMKAIKDMNADAVLIGEALMRATDKKKMLKDLKNG